MRLFFLRIFTSPGVQTDQIRSDQRARREGGAPKEAKRAEGGEAEEYRLGKVKYILIEITCVGSCPFIRKMTVGARPGLNARRICQPDRDVDALAENFP